MKNTLFQDKMVTSNRVLYTPSSFAKNNLIHLQEIGTLQALSEHTSKRSGLASFLFFYIKSGSGELIYEGNTYALTAGDCVFLDCNKSYSHKTSTDLWSLHWAHFYGPNLNKIYEKFFNEHPSPVFHPGHTHDYERILTELQTLTSASCTAKDMMICEKIMGLLANIMLDCEPYDTNKIIPLKALAIADIKDYLDENFSQKISLEELSKVFFIDKYYLTRRFRQQYGITINTYLQNLRITHAKHLLRFSNKTIEAIASECGIDDPNYFARLFKKIEGISPGDFRRGWMNGK